MLRVLIASALLSLAAVPAFADPVTTTIEQFSSSPDVERVGEQVRHRASGYLFPATVGDMPARKVTVYGDADVSVYYTLSGGGNDDAWMDVYVYPALDTNAREAEGVEAAIIDAFHATPTKLSRKIKPQAGGAKSRWFEGQLNSKPLITGYYLAQCSRWQIKIRISMPSPPSEALLDRMEAAIAAVSLDLPKIDTQ